MESVGNNTTLAEVNAYERAYKQPAFVFLGFLAVIGLVGNLFVLYVYGFLIKKKKVQHFITLLAVYDIICCLLGLPLKMLELWMPSTYPSGSLCKMQNAVICFACVASALTLLVISIDRYKKVCRPTKPQLTLIHVKISIGVITFVSLVYAVVAAFVYDRISKPLVKGSDVMTSICSMDTESALTGAYFMALVAVLIIVLVSLLVLYCLVWRTAKEHFADSTVMRSINRSVSQIGQPKRPRKTNTTRILVLISLLFVISFVPSLILSVIFKNISRKKFAYGVKVCIELVYATWGLNSSMNPIIYGFCNRNFIRHLKNLFAQCGGTKEYRSSVTSGDTSGS